MPKWCSASCRQRAWEQRRAASSGLSAVEVVERIVRVPATPPRPQPRREPRNREWKGLIRELTRQVSGHHVDTPYLIGIAYELRSLIEALEDRDAWSTIRWRDQQRPRFTRADPYDPDHLRHPGRDDTW
ncbi:hypothetical protein GCM10011381_10270 [Klenkia taihuensis]|nr:hypothetical protein GCM10011381_10270 [Klenkia taihuensis]